jgi:hypothetical protein
MERQWREERRVGLRLARGKGWGWAFCPIEPLTVWLEPDVGLVCCATTLSDKLEIKNNIRNTRTGFIARENLCTMPPLETGKRSIP